MHNQTSIRRCWINYTRNFQLFVRKQFIYIIWIEYKLAKLVLSLVTIKEEKTETSFKDFKDIFPSTKRAKLKSEFTQDYFI